jgi:catechol 2,3-dioxygenase-like lactoylglutathione lyase family enzyme
VDRDPVVIGVSHITFICKDLAKTSRFLCEIFGAEEIYSSGDKTFSLAKEKFFKIGELWIAIMEGEPVEKTYNHIAFKVDAKMLPELEAKIRALGLVILPGRPRQKEEGESLYFYDYDNHLFELHAGELNQRLDYYQ